MSYAADLHLHSSYAMATSPSITLEGMAAWAAIKGLDVLAASDFTHPVWLTELKRKLVPAGDGLYALREPDARARFMLGTEVSCVYPQDGRSHRLHLLVFAPDFDAVDRLCVALGPYGNLASDGRPILRLSGRDVVEAALTHHEPGVRRHALRLAERRFGESKTLLSTALRLIDDKSSFVRLQLALSLGESANAHAKAGLARLGRTPC